MVGVTVGRQLLIHSINYFVIKALKAVNVGLKELLLYLTKVALEGDAVGACQWVCSLLKLLTLWTLAVIDVFTHTLLSWQENSGPRLIPMNAIEPDHVLGQLTKESHPQILRLDHCHCLARDVLGEDQVFPALYNLISA